MIYLNYIIYLNILQEIKPIIISVRGCGYIEKFIRDAVAINITFFNFE